MVSSQRSETKIYLKNDYQPLTYPMQHEFTKMKQNSIVLQKRYFRLQIMERIKRNIDRYFQRKLKKTELVSTQHMKSIGYFLDIKPDYHLQQKNQQNNISEIKLDGTIDNFNVDLKPVNWKLQKLEKDFLLTYLNTALQRYNKQTCKNMSLPSRDRDYFQKSTITSKLYPYSKCMSSKHESNLFLSKTQMKDKYVQVGSTTSDLLVAKPNQLRDFCLRFMNILKRALESHDTKPLLELKADEVNEFYSFLIQLNFEKFVFNNNKFFHSELETQSRFNSKRDQLKDSFGKDDISNTIKDLVNTENIQSFYEDGTRQQPTRFEKDNSVEAKRMWEDLKNASQRVSEPYGVQKGFREPDIENIAEDFVEYKVHDQMTNEDNKVTGENETDMKTMESGKDPGEITNKENQESNYTAKECVVDEKDLEGETYNSAGSSKLNTSEILLNKENFDKIRKIIESALGETDERIVTLMTNKNDLTEFLIFIVYNMKIIYNVPPLEYMSSVLLERMASVQLEAKLSRITNEVNSGAEILTMYGEICDFINENDTSGNPYELLMNRVMDNYRKDDISLSIRILEIIENPVLFSYILTLIHYKYHHINDTSLITFFNSLPNNADDFLSESLLTIDHSGSLLLDYDVYLVGNLLAIIHMWNRKYTGNDSMEATTEDLELLRIGVENLKQWIHENNVSDIVNNTDIMNTYKKSEIFSVYREYMQITDQGHYKKVLYDIFKNLENLKIALTKIDINHETISSMNVVLRRWELEMEPDENGSPEFTEEKNVSISSIINNDELVRQVLAIVFYWVSVSGEDPLIVLEESQISNDIFINYKRIDNEDQMIFENLSKLINWLKEFIDSSDPDDTPEDIMILNFFSTNIYLLVECLSSDPAIKKYFRNPKYLIELLDNLLLHLQLEDETINDNELLSFGSPYGNLKSETIKYEKTEPISFSPQISEPVGKNKRFSNSEAENMERYSDNYQESTYANVPSLKIAKYFPDNSIDEHDQERIWDVKDTVKSEYSQMISQIVEVDQNKFRKELSQKIDHENTNLNKIYSDNETEYVENSMANNLKHNPVQSNKKTSESDNIKSPLRGSKKRSPTSNSSSIVIEKYDNDFEKELFVGKFVCDTILSDTNMDIVERPMSFNSQMKKLSGKLDNVITSVNLQYDELEGLETSGVHLTDANNTKESVKLNQQNKLNDDTLANDKDQSSKNSCSDHTKSYETKSKNSRRDSNLRILINKAILSEHDSNYKKLSLNAQTKMEKAVVEIYQDRSKETDPVKTSIPPLESSPKIAITNLSREPFPRPSDNINNHEDIIITLSFMVYYLLTVISSRQLDM